LHELNNGNTAVNKSSWPRLRGPNNNGNAGSGKYPVNWDPENVLWKIDIPGKGTSTPIVLDKKIYLTAGVEGQDTVIAYDWSGKQIWQKQLGPETAGKHKNASGSNSSPTTDGSAVFVFFKSGRFAALEMDGTVRWQTNLFERFGEDNRYWDFGTSPVLTKKDVVMAQLHDGDSWLAAFDKVTGKLSWKVPRNYETAKEGSQGYSTPVVFSHKGSEALLIYGGEHLTAHSTADGKIIWSCGDFNPEGKKFWAIVGTPVIAKNVAVVPVGREDRDMPNLHGIKMGGSGDVTKTHRLWNRNDTGSFIPSPAEHKGRVYILRDRGKIECIDPLTGKTLWNGVFPKGKGNFYASPLIAGDHLYATREDGIVFVLGLNDKFEIISEIDMKDSIIASPVAVSGRILIRTKKHLFCIAKNSLIDFRDPLSIKSQKPILIAHRGGVITDQTPECSIAAIRLAKQQGYAMVELDIQKSKDHVPIVFHDSNMKKACNVDKRIKDLSIDEIVKITYVGTDQTICTLDQALTVCRSLKLGLMLDVKIEQDEKFFQDIITIVKKHGYQNASVTINADPVLRNNLKEVALVTVTQDEFKKVQQGLSCDLQNKFWFGLPRNLPSEMVKLLHQNGAYVIPAINTFRYPDEGDYELARKDIQRLNEAGVDGYQIDSVYYPLFSRGKN